MASTSGFPGWWPGPGTTLQYGFAVAAIDAPGCGDRPRSAVDVQHRAGLRRAAQAGEPLDEILHAMIVPLVGRAVPEWRTTLDALLALPEIDGPVGYEGMMVAIAIAIAIGIRLAVVDPRVSAAADTCSTVPTTVVRA